MTTGPDIASAQPSASPPTLAYLAARGGRSRLLTAIGIISIILGCGSTLGNLRTAVRARSAIELQRAFAETIGPWSEAEVQLAIMEIGPGLLSPMQGEAFRRVVMDPRTTFTCYSVTPIAVAVTEPNRSVLIRTSQGGVIEIDANGGSTAQTNSHQRSMSLFYDAGQVAEAPLIALIAVSVVEVALAVVLLAAGILTLIRPGRGMRLHVRYSKAKIVVEIGGLAVFGWFTYRILSSPTVAILSGHEAWDTAISYAVFSAVGMGYAILLLMVGIRKPPDGAA